MPAKIKDHLQQRGTTWHVRLDIPADVRQAFGNRRILSKSLKTGDKQLAKELGARQVGLWKAQFRAIREQKLTQAEKWREDLAEHSKALATSTDNSLLSAIKRKPNPSDPFFALSETEQNQKLSEVTAELAKAIGLLFNDGATSLPSDLMPSLEAAKKGDSIGFLSSALSTLPTAQAQIISRQYNLSPTEAEEALSIAVDPLTYKPKSPISKGMITRFSEYLSTQNDNQRTHSVCVSKIEAFSAHLTAEGLPLSFDTVAQYLDTISAKRQTRQGHLWALRKLWKWAVKYEPAFREQFSGLANPFDGHEHARVGKDAGAGWIPFTRQEAEHLHNAALTNSDTDLADLIMFACYTGCRIEELGRISAATTIFSEGQPIGFRVDDAKTKAGVREIPIHPALLPIYRHRLEHSTDGYLFAGGKAKSGIRLNGPSQRFTKLKKRLNFTEHHVFHSLRKTTATQLQQAGASPLVIVAILGHEVGHISFDTYSAGASFEQKQEGIALLEFSFKCHF
ncbi:tyrosine-type recombinase/integrase [Pseudomonas sp. MBLB4123]|uniref:tyrosine-type recombinase/integrase n=1 Tax=Pseudomonas sp. MBLB4123 TaxID=3451557 RepID=UPI003F74AF67